MPEKIKLGIYRHYKGKTYRVTGTAIDSETLEPMVIYEALYDSEEFGKGSVWVRPLKMFLEKVTIEGKEISRFEYNAEN